MTAVEALHDALARIVTAREGIEDGAVDEAAWVLADLETDLAATLARIEREGGGASG